MREARENELLRRSGLCDVHCLVWLGRDLGIIGDARARRLAGWVAGSPGMGLRGICIPGDPLSFCLDAGRMQADKQSGRSKVAFCVEKKPPQLSGGGHS